MAARYELKEVFDNLIITLCKFTTLLNTHEVSLCVLLVGVILFYTLWHSFRHIQGSVDIVVCLHNSMGTVVQYNIYTLIESLLAHMSVLFLSYTYVQVASSPGPAQFFNVKRRKTGGPGTRLHVM